MKTLLELIAKIKQSLLKLINDNNEEYDDETSNR